MYHLSSPLASYSEFSWQLDQVMRIKSAQAEEMNKMTDMLKTLKVSRIVFAFVVDPD
jgi:hypothetical protein